MLPGLPPIPGARRIEPQRLLSVVAMPFAAALAMATGVATIAVSGDPVAEAGGAVAFVLEFVKFCYLGVAVAHLSGALAERFQGGLPAGVWLAESDADESAPSSRPGFWDAFPNHVDGAAIAFAVTALCWAMT